MIKDSHLCGFGHLNAASNMHLVSKWAEHLQFKHDCTQARMWRHENDVENPYQWTKIELEGNAACSLTRFARGFLPQDRDQVGSDEPIVVA